MISSADPCVMVIFGGSGDLAMRKIIPALFHLEQDGLLPENFAVLGIAREALTSEAYRQRVHQVAGKHISDSKKSDDEAWDRLIRRFYYQPGNAEDPATYDALGKTLQEIDQECGTQGNRIYYLATLPSLFPAVVKRLGTAGLVQETPGTNKRIVFEKPFGHDYESALALNRVIREYLEENQVFRIDHYLGKETVQNIMVFRFSNGIFEPIWNRRYIDSVQITVAEELGVEDRGGYYDRSGALRDMVPNHLFQLLSMIAMEPPNSFEADDVRDEKNKVLNAIKCMSPEEVLRNSVRGQYGEGLVGGKKVPAYRSESSVPPESNTETYAALKLSIDNWRWAGVPFYLRTGKRMKRRLTEVSVQFRRPPFHLFQKTQVSSLSPNHIVIQIQPEERISLQFGAKIPGPVVHIGNVEMDFNYQQRFGNWPNTGYETLLYDCMKGDATLFQRADQVETSWSVITPILDVWSALQPREFPNYESGTWGPAEADELLARDGRVWRTASEEPTAAESGLRAVRPARGGNLSVAS